MHKYKLILSILAGAMLSALLLFGCTPAPTSCESQPPADLTGAPGYALDDGLDFQFPLEQLGENVVDPSPAIFCTHGCSQSDCEYHAAEDYHLPAGTPVYAIADGLVSFSGPMGGYGWLIIVDHPQANIYSLYGHLSPNRWRHKKGPVMKGDLIAYLGDEDENGGSAKNPLRTHLHFGIRAGQRDDYPGKGEWRWMAGWIKPCPQDLGWLRPSAIITGQEIPPGGFKAPGGGLIEMWGLELAFLGMYLVGGVFALINSVRTNKPILPVFFAALMIAAGWVLSYKSSRLGYALFALAAFLLVFGIVQFMRNSWGKTGG